MKLYAFPPSPNTWKVRAVAAQLGIPLELEFVDLTKPRTAHYLALNPTGRVPTLADGDFVLGESNAIMQYLASRTSNTLWPNDARTRADVMRWQSWQLAHWSKEGCEPLIFQRLVKKLLNLGPPDDAILAKGTEAFNREARVLDAHLSKHSYLVGNAVTLADFAVAAPLFYAKEADLPIAPYAGVQDWFGRVSALPAWRGTARRRGLRTQKQSRAASRPPSLQQLRAASRPPCLRGAGRDQRVGTGFSPR
jgi:glutathione S-transferase